MCWYKEKLQQSDLQKLVCTAKDFTPEPNQFSKDIIFFREGAFLWPSRYSEIDSDVIIITKILDYNSIHAIIKKYWNSNKLLQINK